MFDDEFQKRLREQYSKLNETTNNIYKWATEIINHKMDVVC